MPKTHYEIASGMFESCLAEARERVKRLGWNAYVDWTQNISDADRESFAEALELPEKGWMLADSRAAHFAQMGAALMQAIVEFATLECEDEFNFKEIYHSPTMIEFSAWLEDWWRRAHPFASRRETQDNFASLSTTFNQVIQEVCHRKAGFRVYEVSPGLGQRLQHTELRGLMVEDLALPYRSVYLIVPRQVGLETFNVETGMHPLHGMYITESREDGSYSKPGDPPVPGTEGNRSWHFLAVGASKNSADPLDDSLVYFRTDLAAGQSLDDAITYNDKHLENLNSRVLDHTTFKTDIQYLKTAWRQLFSWALNCMVYATWPEADRFEVVENPEVRKALEKMQKHPKGSHQYEKAREIARTQQAQRRIVLGRSFTEWQEPAQPPETHGTGSGSPLLVRTKVPGHWQRYWYGKKGHQEQRWKLKEPYWKNPEGSPEVPSVHVLR